MSHPADQLKARLAERMAGHLGHPLFAIIADIINAQIEESHQALHAATDLPEATLRYTLGRAAGAADVGEAINAIAAQARQRLQQGGGE